MCCALPLRSESRSAALHILHLENWRWRFFKACPVFNVQLRFLFFLLVPRLRHDRLGKQQEHQRKKHENEARKSSIGQLPVVQYRPLFLAL